MNHHRRFLAAAVLIGLLIVTGFLASVPHTKDVPGPARTASDSSPVPAVTLHDSFRKGTHTITGSVVTPNYCTSVSAQASVVGTSTSPSIVVAISMPKDSGICLQENSVATFTVTATAPAHAPISATVNGAVATTTP